LISYKRYLSLEAKGFPHLDTHLGVEKDLTEKREERESKRETGRLGEWKRMRLLTETGIELGIGIGVELRIMLIFLLTFNLTLFIKLFPDPNPNTFPTPHSNPFSDPLPNHFPNPSSKPLPNPNPRPNSPSNPKSNPNPNSLFCSWLSTNQSQVLEKLDPIMTYLKSISTDIEISDGSQVSTHNSIAGKLEKNLCNSPIKSSFLNLLPATSSLSSISYGKRIDECKRIVDLVAMLVRFRVRVRVGLRVRFRVGLRGQRVAANSTANL
jgi:hypothetical protein